MATTATSSEFSRIINTTLRNYLRIEENAVVRRRIMLSKLKSMGRILFNCDGDGFQWYVRYRRAKMQSNNGMQALSFQAENRWQRANLDYEGYAITDAISKREKLKNRGTAAMISVFKRLIPLMMEDMEDEFSEELYVDANAAGNNHRMSGLETMFETNGTINVGSGAQRSANAADPCGYPNSTYANLSTQLGAFSGSWGEGTGQTSISTTWPSGRGDPEYDFWSPVIVNFTSSAFGQTAWWTESSAVGNAVPATRFAIYKMKRNSRDTIPLVMMDADLYRQYLDGLNSYQRILVSRQANEKPQFGFRDSIVQDGAEITFEYGIPSGVAYGIDLENVELMSMQGQLFEADGPSYDPATRSDRLAVDVLGQFKYGTPRAFFKMLALA